MTTQPPPSGEVEALVAPEELARLVLAATCITDDSEEWQGRCPRVTINHVGFRSLRERLLSALDQQRQALEEAKRAPDLDTLAHAGDQLAIVAERLIRARNGGVASEGILAEAEMVLGRQLNAWNAAKAGYRIQQFQDVVKRAEVAEAKLAEAERDIRDRLSEAYQQGCLDTHRAVRRDPELAQDDDPEFAEAGHDYAIRAAASYSPSTREGGAETYRHVKRGGAYTVVGNAILQSEEPLHDGASVLVYRGEGGDLWARPPDEFNDGRFVLPSPSTPAPKGGDAV